MFRLGVVVEPVACTIEASKGVCGCGGWLFWQLVWSFNDGQDWQMGFVGCWVKGLWLTGNLLVAWYVWVLRDGFLMLVWQRCCEGILKVVWWLDFWWWKIYDESFFSFFLVLDWLANASNRSVFALIPNMTQDNQNKTKITIK